MDTDKKTALIKSSIQVVLVLFASFGGFLLNIAPPSTSQNTLQFAVGIAQFIVLCLMLFVSAFTNYSLVLNAKRFKKNYKLWLVTGGVFFVLLVATSILYFQANERLVLKVDNWGASFVRGDLTTDALNLCAENKYGVAGCEGYLIEHEYGVQDIENGLLWTKQSVQSNEMQLLLYYLGFTIALSACLFSFVELLTASFVGPKARAAKSLTPV